MKTLHKVTWLACLTVLLSNCSQGMEARTGEPRMDIFNQKRTGADELPGDYDNGQIDPSTARFLTERNGLSYFAARTPQTDSTACIIVTDQTDGFAGCSAFPEDEAFGPNINGLGVEAMLVQDDADTADLTGKQGWKLVHANLLVRPAPGSRP